MCSSCIIGLDNGYGYTKLDNGIIFKSACTTLAPFAVECENQIEVNGKSYYVGCGTETLQIDKSDSELNRICSLYALSKCDGEHFSVVVGLPINQHSKEEKAKFENAVRNWSGSKVKTNGTEKQIFIDNVKCFNQGLASLYSSEIKNDVIILDVGARTVDVALIVFEGNIPTVVKHNTYYCGCMQLYGKIIAEVNWLYKLTLEEREALNIIQNGLYINGLKADTSFIPEVCRIHFSELLNALERDYPSKTTAFLLCGGGSALLYNAIKKRFYNVSMLKDGQFSNAKGYKKVGEMLWQTK